MWQRSRWEPLMKSLIFRIWSYKTWLLFDHITLSVCLSIIPWKLGHDTKTCWDWNYRWCSMALSCIVKDEENLCPVWLCDYCIVRVSLVNAKLAITHHWEWQNLPFGIHYFRNGSLGSYEQRPARLISTWYKHTVVQQYSFLRSNKKISINLNNLGCWKEIEIGLKGLEGLVSSNHVDEYKLSEEFHG